MLIALDIGNSKTKAGLFEKNKLIEIFSFNDIVDVIKFIESSPGRIAVSSVVPHKTKTITDAVKGLNNKNIFLITKEIKTNLDITYKTPGTLGIDRLCSAEGAFYLFRNSYKNYNKKAFIISIDLGTASTLNVVELPGKFIGGLIAPGMDMMFESLKQNTAQLPLLNESEYVSIIGSDTNSSIASGVITSVIGMMERVINFLKEDKSAEEIFIYLTGGNANKIIPFLNFDFVYEEGLVLYGIYSLWKLNPELSTLT